MNQKYRSQIEEINQTSNSQAAVNINAVYRKQKDALNDFLVLIAMMYLQYSVNGLMAVNRLKKIQLLNDINLKLDKIYKDLGEVEEKTDIIILKKQYEDLYNEIAKTTNSIFENKLSVPKLTPSQIEKAVNTPIDGELFSERIWKNKESLTKNLRKYLNEILKGEITIDQAGKDIQNIFGVAAYQTKRLLDTELTRIQAQASNNICHALNIKKHMWSAAFENTCAHCMGLDGQVFDVDDDGAPDIPAHPNCKCIWVPYIDDKKISQNNNANVWNSGIMNTRVKSGALDPDGEEANIHSIKYYESVRHMKSDVERISKNTGWDKEKIAAIKNHIFYKKHDLGNGKLENFIPNYSMGQTWQRLIEGKNIQPHDITLLNHEYLELSLMKDGYSQGEAHIIASKKYNYRKESEAFENANLKKHKKDK